MRRKLPFSAKLWFYTKVSTVIAAIVLIFGVFLCIQSVNVKKLYYEYLLNSNNENLNAVILDVWERDWDNLDRVSTYGYDYYFIHPDLGEIKNTSYGQHARTIYNKNQSVIVEYNKESPYANRLKKLDFSEAGFNVLWYLMVPVTGLIFMLVVIRKPNNKIKLLEQGEFTWGKLLRKDRAFMDTEEAPKFTLIYGYKDNDGNEYEGGYSTDDAEAFHNKELIVYNTKNPWEILVLYDLPRSITAFIDKNWEEVKNLH